LWINDGSVTPTAQPGLVCLKVQAFTAVSAVNVEDVFSALYDNYRIMWTFTPSATSSVDGRLRVAGADNTTANYNRQDGGADGSTMSGGKSTSATSFSLLNEFNAGGKVICSIDMFSPNLAEPTMYTGLATRSTNTIIVKMTAGLFNAATVFTGFSLLVASGTITGTVTVYGYRKSA
jgi:hypothetical protein